jgi:pimeloyl-ACP methyl ester carboxylesterase
MITSTPNPAPTYAEALARVQAGRQQDQTGLVRPDCLPRLLDHGAPAEWAVVILHGFSTCPEQFQELGERLFDLGFNIYIPRQPYHGLAERTANNLAPLTAEELAAYGAQALDVGRGLGRQVLLIGLSGGGTVAAWLAQNRPDLEIAMPIAPMLGVSFIPSALTRPFAWLFNHVPDFYMWWDPRNKAENPYAVDYSYPGYSIRAMSECLKLGVWVRRQARLEPAKAHKIVMVINDNEPGVNNPEVYKVMADWAAHPGGPALDAFHFDKSLKLPHDLITPGTPGLDIETVYRLLIGRIMEETAQAV